MSFDESQRKLLWDHPTSLVYDKKLDTALRDTIIRQNREKLTSGSEGDIPFDLRLLLKNISKEELLSGKTDSSCYGHILGQILDDSINDKLYATRKSHQLTKCFKLAKENLRLQHEYSIKSNYLPSAQISRQALKDKLDNLTPTTELMNLMHIANEFRKIIDRMGHSRRRLGNDKTDEEKLDILSRESKHNMSAINLKMAWTPNQCVLWTVSGGIFWVPTSYVLLIHNKLCDLVSSLLLVLYLEGVCYQDNAYSVTMNFVREFCELAIYHENSFANISGSLEGMVIGEILLETEEWYNQELLDNITKDLRSSNKFDYMRSKLRMILLTADIPLRNELGCLSKILGHPFVDMKAGAIKLHKRTTKPKELTYQSLIWVVNKAKETFVKNYLARHGKWPICEFTYQLTGSDPLLQACLKNEDPDSPVIVSRYGKITNDDWSRVELGKVEEFHELDNIIPYLKDKSISVLRNEAVLKYLEFERSRRGQWADTRLLLYYLLNPLRKLDHKEFIRQYCSAASLDELADYLVIRLVPKEKEHKIEFRGFGVKTYLDRLRSLTQEKNMARFLDLYCDEQAMTLGEVDISKRLYAFRCVTNAYAGYKVLYVNFDSSGWNNCFRDETVKPVIRETVSKVMGSDLLHRIHEAYEKSLFLIPDGDVTYSWEGQQGGIDGLNQYAWVWVYVNQIKYAIKDLPVKFHMLCKGDDMRLAILIHPVMLERHDMSYWHSTIVHRVEAVAKEFGHEIKIQESYGSEKFFTFSKSASIDTIELPQGFRKIQKVYGANNAMIATLDEYIASSFSNAHSACKCMTNTYGAYFVALVWSFWYMCLSMYYKNCSDKEYLALSLVPNMLGGFPIIYLHNMRVRAESDLLSPFLAIMIFLRSYDISLYNVLKRFLKIVVPYKRNFTKLYRDPYSLWIRTPMLPTAKLRSFILPILARKVENEDIKELINACKSRYSKDIVTCLSSANPQNAKVLSTVYSATPEGVLTELLKKFESGRSILDLIILKSGRNKADKMIKTVLRTEEILQTWRYEKISDNLEDPGRYYINIDYYNCPTRAAQELRDLTWGKVITGISMPPLSHQVSLYRPMDVEHDDHARKNHFLYTFNHPTKMLSRSSKVHWGTGEFTPFLGYTTRTGNISPTVTFIENDPLVLKIRNLLDLLSWVNVSKVNPNGSVTESNLNVVIKNLILNYTNISAEELAPFSATRKSGTVQHHARAPRFRESIVPNVLSNMYQNVSGTSDTHVTLRESDLHFTINFLHIMCENIHQIQIELETGCTLTSPKLVWGVTTQCEYCTRPIEEDPIVVDLSLMPIAPPVRLNANKVEEVAKNIVLRSYTDFNERGFKPPHQDNNPEDSLAIAAVISEFVAHHLKVQKSMQSRFTQHVMSGKAYQVLVNLSHAHTTRVLGFTELKKIPVDDLINSLSPVIVQYVSQQLRDYSHDDLMLGLQKVYSSELPWHGILEVIHKAGMMGVLISRLERVSRTKAPPCYENPMAASSYVGYAIHKLVMANKVKYRLAIRSYMSHENIRLEINALYAPMLWTLLDKQFIQLTRSWIPGTEDDDLKMRITRRGFYVACMHIDPALFIEHFDQYILENELNAVDIREIVRLDEEMIDLTLDDVGSFNHSIYRWLRLHYPSWPWDAIEQEYRTEGTDDELVNYLLECHVSVEMEVGLTDIASSIEAVRRLNRPPDPLGDVRYDANSSDSEFDIDRRNEQLISRGIKSPVPSLCFVPRSPVSASTVVPTIHCEEPDFTYDKIVLDNSHFYRIYGSSTTSQCKLDYILSVTRTSKEMPNHLTILCSGEGFGGFIEYLSSCTTSSRFVFNTLPPRLGKNCFPYSATNSLLDNNNEVDTNLIDSGIYDLSTDECISSLTKAYSYYDIITCDADIAWGHRESVRLISEGLIKIFLNNSHPSTIFIMKSNLGYAQIVISCVSVLRRYCDKVYVIRCPQSNIGGEVYIFATSKNSAPLDPKNVSFSASDLEHSEFQVYVRRVFKKFENQLKYQPALQLYPALIRSMCTKFADLEPSATAKFTTRLSIDIDIKAICEDSDYIDDCLKETLDKVKSCMTTYHDILLNPLKYQLRHVRYEQNYRSHLIHVSMRFLTVAGCYYILKLFGKIDNVTKAMIRSEYTRYLDLIPRRLKLGPATADHYKKSFSMLGVPFFAPYARFMDGIRLGQMTVGYFRHSRKPKHVNVDIINLF